VWLLATIQKLWRRRGAGGKMQSARPIEAKSEDTVRVFAYGFDAAGFQCLSQQITVPNVGVIQFVSVSDDIALDTADALIVPQGIFERIEHDQTWDGPQSTVKVREPLLLARERQAYNILRDRTKWTCFLVGQVQDTVPDGDYQTREIKDTDLCKRMLNLVRVDRVQLRGTGLVLSKRDEFTRYLSDYGVAKTGFRPTDPDMDIRTLAVAGRHSVGIECGGTLFFLPFHTARKGLDDAAKVARMVTEAVVGYRQKRIVEIPQWVTELQFDAEQKLREKQSVLIEQLTNVRDQLQSWDEYKSILVTSGDELKVRVVRILERFFGLNVDPLDEGREDAKILDQDGSDTLAVVEVKGTNKGIKREHINQVDSHRERHGLSESTPGVLFINNEMTKRGIESRLETAVPADQVGRAKKLNVLIVRTIDLLFLMRHLESRSDRGEELMRLVRSGGGWLSADADGYRLVDLPQR